MKYNPEIHHRRSIRLKGYDYSQDGAYFVTICTQNRECVFGDVKNNSRGTMLCALNEYGKITWNELQKTSEIRKNMKINCCVVMPNHIHAIMVIENPMTDVGAYCNTPLQSGNTPLQTATKFQSPSNNLGSMIRGYKSTVTKQINELRKTPGETIWQRNYHEHIIRNEKSYEKIYHYILHNPEKWEEDKFYVEN